MPSAITLTVSNLPVSTSFFLSALQPLDYNYRGATDNNTTVAFGSASNPNSPPDLWLTQEIPGVPVGAAHVAFPAGTRIAVQQFFNAALKAGAKVHGEPAVRDASGYYSAAVIDFDGNSIEAVYRPTHAIDHKEHIHHDGTVAPVARTEVSRIGDPVNGSKEGASKAPSPSPKVQTAKSGDVIDVATNLARNVVQSLRPGSSHSTSSNKNAENSESRGTKAIVGTLIGIAAGATLSYAFGKDRDKEKSSRERHAHRPFSPPRSATYPSTSRYHSSSDLPTEQYRYTQSPLAIEAPPFPRRRSSSCHASPRREMAAEEFEHMRRRRGSSAIDGHSSTRRSRRSSVPANDAPIIFPPLAPSSATSKHSRRSHSSKHHKAAAVAVEDPSPSHHSPPSRRRNSTSASTAKPPSKRDRTLYPPSSFSPTTKSKVESAGGYPIHPPRAHTFDGAGPTSNSSSHSSSKKSTASPATTVKSAAPIPTGERSRRSSRHDSRGPADLETPLSDREKHRKHHRHDIHPPPPPPVPKASRPRADTWHGPGLRPRAPPQVQGPATSSPIPPPFVTDPLHPRAPDPLMHSRRRRASNVDAHPNHHRSRKGSMRKNRVVGVDLDPDADADRDFDRDLERHERKGKDRARDSGFWEARKSVEVGSSLKGGIMDKEVTPDESISQVSTNY